mmetsp:Transcript_16147/g.32166  ORF Transcript_16147/g.32166 Transcript_16147/m.32166 type:complete len:225 (-) Transcript_16147:593-1267(-)
MQTFTSPLSLMPSGVVLWTPPRSMRSTPLLTSWWPKTPGATLATSFVYRSDVDFMRRMSSRSSGVSSRATLWAVAFSDDARSSSGRRVVRWVVWGRTDEAMKTVLYVSSLTPRDLRPDTPCPVCVGREDVAASPALARPPPSGTTARKPVKTHLSPALAPSTPSPLTITSMLRGMLPGGTSPAFSCTLSLCQSVNVDSAGRSWKSLRFWQRGLAQRVGGVYWNC